MTDSNDQQSVPPGTPQWISRELIDKTIAVWQRFYAAPLTAQDAVEMLLNVGQFFRAIRMLESPAQS